jgi:hypothetical protein
MTTPSPTDHTILVPVGHAMGGVPDRDGLRYEVRRRANIERLDQQEAAAWALSHGEVTAAQAPPGDGRVRAGVDAALQRLAWALDRFAEAMGPMAAAAGRPAPEVVVGLLERGLLVATPVDGAPAVAFAQQHRLVPLLLGLGATEMPGEYGIGLPGVEVLAVAAPIYEIWARSPVYATLWDTCRWFAGTVGADAAPVEPGRVVAGVLGNLHGLLSSAAAYVD